MGASNFASPSTASKLFVVLASTEEIALTCVECNEEILPWEENYEELKLTKICSCGCTLEEEEKSIPPSEWAAEDLIECLGEDIAELGGYKENESIGNDSSYYKQSVGRFLKSKSYGDIEVEVEVTALIQSAYYEGATLDYEVKIGICGDLRDVSTGSRYDEEIDDIVDDCFTTDHSYMNSGLLAIHRSNAKSWLDNTVTELGAQLEVIFETHQQYKLTRVGGFSDGTSLYESVN